MFFTISFLFAIALDLVFGDPRWLPHPVRYIGWLCTSAEKISREKLSNESYAGIASFLIVLVLTLLPLAAVFFLLHAISPLLESFVAVVFIYLSIACRDLIGHSMAVYRALTIHDDLELARKEVGKIVGRDTSALDREGISRACVETVAENLVDGVTAPVFYALLFSMFSGVESLSALSMAALGAWGYKAINTMDSMYGYKNSRYIHFGRFAAQFDDLVNFLPARLSGIFLIIATALFRFDTSNAMKMFVRDRLNHSSPNAGHPEAAVAGALGVQLGGASIYFGERVEKPTLGDRTRSILPSDIVASNKLMVGAALMFTFALLVLRTIYIL